MQGHLLEADGKPVHARDILTVARRLVRLLENEGLVLEGRIGERVSFDPDRHALLANDDAAPGHSVLVRFPSVSYRGKILRKAGVDKTGE